jgi:hypothetical protein
MREFRTAMMGTVDLDDPKTYEYLPQTEKELDNKMFEEIGKALVYVKYFRPGWDKKQVKRINILIKDFADNRQKNYGNVQWIKEQVFMFQDETENMC